MENLFSKFFSSAGSNGRLTCLLDRSNFLLSSPVLVWHPLCCEFYCLQLMIAQYLLFVPWCGHSWNYLTQTDLFWGEIVVCIQEKQWFVAFHRAWFLFCRARPELTSDEPCLTRFFQATWGRLMSQRIPCVISHPRELHIFQSLVQHDCGPPYFSFELHEKSDILLGLNL